MWGLNEGAKVFHVKWLMEHAINFYYNRQRYAPRAAATNLDIDVQNTKKIL